MLADGRLFGMLGHEAGYVLVTPVRYVCRATVEEILGDRRGTVPVSPSGSRQPLTAGGFPTYHPRGVHSSAEIRMHRASNRSGRTTGDNVLFRRTSVVSAGRGA